MSQSDANRRIYEDPDAVEIYAEVRPPQQGELAIFGPLEDELRDARLLDIGVGGGRTAAYLGPLVGDYLGVDYSQALVDAAAAAYPHLEFAWGDARDLSAYADASFDIAYFSFNGLDSLDHEGRLQVLAEVRRVLVPGGRFVFSSHNRDYARRGFLPWQGRPKPGRVMLKKSREALRARHNWRRLRPLQRETPEYALVNDEAHDYSLLHYYIAPLDQIAQLEAAGFTDVAVRDQWGAESTRSPASIWMFYSARTG